ncbi:MAG: ABC transporter substrate-binding protein, partial [Gammaproteobacteria bacterium]
MSIFSAPKSNPLVATLLLGLLASLAATLWPFLSNEGESEDSPLRIAVVSKGLGPDSTEGILLGARLLVDQVNEGGGLNGRPLELDVYDDEGNPDLGKAKAREIADSRALAVIGHRYSAVSLAVGSIYRQSGVPVVSAASTARDVTRNNAWYFRTVFSDDQQARLLAEYTKSVLDVDRVHVVYG